MGANITIFSNGDPISVGSSLLQLMKKEKDVHYAEEITYISSATCYTVHQACILQVTECPSNMFLHFDHSLALGSSYDIAVVVTTERGSEIQSNRTFLHRVFCNNVPIPLTDIITSQNELSSGTWKCSHCKKLNTKGIKICTAQDCLVHKDNSYLAWSAMVPVLGLPFAFTLVIQKWAKACVKVTRGSIVDAVLETLFVAVDIALMPLVVCQGLRILAKAACKIGVSCFNDLYRRLGMDAFYRLIKPVFEPIQRGVTPVRAFINKNKKTLLDEADNL